MYILPQDKQENTFVYKYSKNVEIFEFGKEDESVTSHGGVNTSVDIHVTKLKLEMNLIHRTQRAIE